MKGEWRRQGDRLRGTRRQVLESALVDVRPSLYLGLLTVVEAERFDDAVAICTSIRRASEALGYVTPWTSVPWQLLYWMEVIETLPGYAMVAERWARSEVPGEPWEPPPHLREQLRWAERDDFDGA